MTFSGNGMPDDLIRMVKKTLKGEGFELSEFKTRILRNNMSQRVTGLIVNNKLNVSKQYYRKIRSVIHNMEPGRKIQTTKFTLNKCYMAMPITY